MLIVNVTALVFQVISMDSIVVNNVCKYLQIESDIQSAAFWPFRVDRPLMNPAPWSSIDESCPFLPKHERVQSLCLVFQRKMKQGNNFHQWTTKFPSASNELKEARDILGSPTYNRQFLAPPARLAARPWPNGAKGSAALRG